MATAASPTLDVGTYDVEVSRLSPAPDNIRTDLGDLTELTDSIREQGVLEPLLVCPDGTIVCGHRRHAAAVIAEVATVPCVVREMTPAQRVAAMLAENLQRTDITPVEEARGFQLLLGFQAEFADADAVAQRVGVRPQRVKDRVALMGLPREVLEDLVSGLCQLGWAMDLTRLNGHPAEQAEVITRARSDWGSGAKNGESAIHWYDPKNSVEDALKTIRQAERRVKVVAGLPKGTKLVKLISPWKGSPANEIPKGMKRVVAKAPQYDSELEKVVVLDPKAHAKLTCHGLAVSPTGQKWEICKAPDTHPVPKQKRRSGQKVDVGNIPTFEATAEARKAVELLVAQDKSATREELLTVVLDFVRQGYSYGGRRDVLADGADVYETLALAGVLMLSDPTHLQSWSPNTNPFEDGASRGARSARRYYELLQAHGYELSEGEAKLLVAALEAEKPKPKRSGRLRTPEPEGDDASA